MAEQTPPPKVEESPPVLLEATTTTIDFGAFKAASLKKDGNEEMETSDGLDENSSTKPASSW